MVPYVNTTVTENYNKHCTTTVFSDVESQKLCSLPAAWHCFVYQFTYTSTDRPRSDMNVRLLYYI